MNFTAIDLETANSTGAICSIALVKVRNGEIIDSFESLVFTSAKFNPINSSIHGIKQEDILNAPKFNELPIKEFIGEDFLVAHNAPSDERCIIKAYKELGEENPFTFIDTLGLSKINLDCENYKLRTLCVKYLNYDFTEHNALADAKACTNLFIYLVSNFYQDVSLIEIKSEKFRRKYQSATINKDDIEVLSNLLENKTFCITNNFPITQQMLEILILQNGGNISSSVNKKTDFLILGERSEKERIANGEFSTKHKKALDNSLPIVSFADFLQMINITN